MHVTPLPEIAFGVTIYDIDLTDLNAGTWSSIESAFNEHGLLVFPGQHLDADAQAVFAQRFGPLQGEASQAHSITNRRKDNSVLTETDDTWLTLSYPTQYWHADGTFGKVPPNVCMLGAASIVSEGGQTGFADMTAAYEALDTPTKDKIADLAAYHSNLAGSMRVHSKQNREYLYSLVGDEAVDGHYGLHMSVECPLRPLTRKHPVTGRTSLFLGRHTFGIPGMSLEEGNALLRNLEDFACQPPRVFEHDWQLGDLVVWDNLRLLHRARPYNEQDERRILLNCRVAGNPETDSGLESEAAKHSAEVQRAEIKRLLELD